MQEVFESGDWRPEDQHNGGGVCAPRPYTSLPFADDPLARERIAAEGQQEVHQPADDGEGGESDQDQGQTPGWQQRIEETEHRRRHDYEQDR